MGAPRTYLVGGAVRDELLGLPLREKDWVVVGSTPEEMAARGFKPVGKDFPVFLHPETKEEYALARTERKTAPGYHGFVFHSGPEVTLEDDLKRRDLTVNAIARDDAGTLIDPFGGQRDVAQRVLRHVSPAFLEDPVRILRLARFYSRFRPLGFSVAPETMALLRKMVANGEVDALQPERVWQELRRALDEDDPAAFFELLRECGALARVFPEVDALFGVPQTPKHHPEIDTGVHVMMALRIAARMKISTEVRFAVLCHDLGKGATPKEILPKHHGHEARGVPLVEALCNRLRAPNSFRELAVIASRYHLHVHLASELRASTIMELFEATAALRSAERFDRFLQACEADARGRTGYEDRAYPQADFLREALKVASEMKAPAVVADGYEGEAVGEELRKRRVAALKTWKESRR